MMTGDIEKFKVGYWVTTKRFEKINFNKFQALCESEGISVKELNLKQDLKPQGPFHVIIHRVSDLICQQKSGDWKAAALLGKFKQYMHKNPDTVLLDPLSAVRKLSHRFKMCKFIQKTIAFEDVRVPAFIRVQDPRDSKEMVKKINKSGLTYPLVAKPVMAHDHNLMLIFNEGSLKQLEQLRPPILLQTYVPHNGILYKINVIEPNISVLARPSLKNFKADTGRAALSFHTHMISKPGCQTDLNAPATALKKVQTPDYHKVARIVKNVRTQMNLSMFGVDVIIERGTKRHYIIDINYFPGFEGVDNVPEQLLALTKKNLARAQKRIEAKKKGQGSHSASTASELTITEELLLPPN